MHGFVTCKLKKNQINSNKEKVKTSIILDFQGQLTPLSAVGYGRKSNSSKVLCMFVPLICKYEKDMIKNMGENVITSFFPIISLWIFFSDAPGQLTQ